TQGTYSKKHMKADTQFLNLISITCNKCKRLFQHALKKNNLLFCKVQVVLVSTRTKLSCNICHKVQFSMRNSEATNFQSSSTKIMAIALNYVKIVSTQVSLLL